MHAIDLLEEQHRELESIFAQVFETEVSGKRRLVKILADKLMAHMEVEEEIFYPEAYDVESNEVREAVEEHNAMRPLIDDLLAMDCDDDDFDDLLSELEEKVSHHIKDEEKVLFPDCRIAISERKLMQLGEDMADLLDKLEGLARHRPSQPKWNEDYASY